MDKKIAIIGFGKVGKAFYELFKDHYEVMIYDPAVLPFDDFPMKEKDEINHSDFAIICVPTPAREKGECDISIVEDTVKWLKVPLILIKSTISPKTTEYLKEKYKKRIVFSPEYIGEGNYFVQYWKHPHPTLIKYHDFQIFGGDKKDTSECINYFIKVMGPMKFYAQTDSRTAELVKYAENNWGATKVTWANEWYEICKAFDRDWHEVRELWALDGRVEKMHTAVFKDKRGWSGKCYPKDNRAIIFASNKEGYKPEFLEAMLKSNERFNKINEKKK